MCGNIFAHPVEKVVLVTLSQNHLDLLAVLPD